MSDTSITLTLDGELVLQIEPILEANGLTLEELAISFITWCVNNPEEAKSALRRWQAESAP